MESTTNEKTVNVETAQEAVADVARILTEQTAALSVASPANPAIPPADGSCPLGKMPLEIREIIYMEYLKDPGNDLDGRRHEDSFGNECCFWNWPEELIACDMLEGEVPPPLISSRSSSRLSRTPARVSWRTSLAT